MKNLQIILCVLLATILSGCNTSINYLEKANKEFERKNYKSAIKIYQKAIDKNLENAEALAGLCECKSILYDKEKSIDLSEAMNYCNKALKINNKNAKAHFYKGRIFGQLNKHKEAIEEYTKTIELNNTDILFSAYYNRAFEYKNINEKDNAIKDYKQIAKFEITKKDADDYLIRGLAKHEIKDDIGAIFDFQKSIEIDSKNKQAWIGLILSQTLAQYYQSAADTANTALKKFPNYELFYYLRGESYIKNKIMQCSANKIEVCQIGGSDWDDINKAKELSLKHNNESVYKACFDFEKDIQKLAQKLDTDETQKSPERKSKLKQILDEDSSDGIFDLIGNNILNKYYSDLVQNEIKKYNMAKQQGDTVNMCVSAGIIAQGYYELKENANYNKWNSIEKQTCDWMY